MITLITQVHIIAIHLHDYYTPKHYFVGIYWNRPVGREVDRLQNLVQLTPTVST